MNPQAELLSLNLARAKRRRAKSREPIHRGAQPEATVDSCG
jgi:hypothetical protein